MQNKITLAYWGFRGFGQVSRLLLAYSGLEWENKSYTDREQWFGNDKANSGFDFPNLPHIIDGDFKLT
jgi:glutathione S-transferase